MTRALPGILATAAYLAAAMPATAQEPRSPVRLNQLGFEASASYFSRA